MSFKKLLCGCIPRKSPKSAKNLSKRPENSSRNFLNCFARSLSESLLLKDEENVIYSPFSIVSALCMALAGSRESTFVEMREVLGLDDELDVIEAVEHVTRQMLIILEGKGDTIFINKNKALFEQDLKIKSSYEEVLITKFQADLTMCNFRDNAESEADRVNHWIADATYGKITDLISAEMLSQATKAVLLNALYFKGDWQLAFDERNTEKRSFYLPDGSVQETDMMYAEMTTDYAKYSHLECSAIRLKLQNSQFKVMFVLPDDRDGLPSLLSTFFIEYKAGLDGILKQEHFHSTAVEVSLPKFKIQRKFTLKEILSNLGMPIAFDCTADFRGISDSTELHISEVLHEAMFEIDEKGAEAAAATAVMITAACSNPSPVVLPQFKADHPFLFALLSANDTVLFFGRMSNPNAAI